MARQGAEAPFIPAWTNLPRMAREAVTFQLQHLANQHMASATRAKLAGDEKQARADFQIADAYHAALAYLDFVPLHDDRTAVREERLEAAGEKAVTEKTSEKIPPPTTQVGRVPIIPPDVLAKATEQARRKGRRRAASER